MPTTLGFEFVAPTSFHNVRSHAYPDINYEQRITIQVFLSDYQNMIQCALIEKYDEITQILHFIIYNKQGNFALIYR